MTLGNAQSQYFTETIAALVNTGIWPEDFCVKDHKDLWTANRYIKINNISYEAVTASLRQS
jgi:hypothetical protein